MKKRLTAVVDELAEVETKLKTAHDDESMERKTQLLAERTELLAEELIPLRTAVLGLHGIEPSMALSKQWRQEFRKLPPLARLKALEDALRITKELAVAIHVELPEKEPK